MIGRFPSKSRLTGVKGPAPMSNAAPAVGMALHMPGIARCAVRNTALAAISDSPASEHTCAPDQNREGLDRTLEALVFQPFDATDTLGKYDVWAKTLGGGISGQAGALRHGISKALTYFEPDLRGQLKKGGFLTRDSRVVERKKYGRAKARKSFQFSKR